MKMVRLRVGIVVGALLLAFGVTLAFRHPTDEQEGPRRQIDSVKEAAANREQAKRWDSLRKTVFNAPDDEEFIQGLPGVLSSDDADIRSWARVQFAIWAPVVRRIREPEVDPLESPEGDPAWEGPIKVARAMGLEAEVAKHPRGGPALAKAIRAKANLHCWFEGKAKFHETIEVPLDAFSPKLRFRLWLGKMRTLEEGHIGEAILPVDVIPVEGTLFDQWSNVLARFERDRLVLPGSLMEDVPNETGSRECIMLWLRGAGGDSVHWWLLPMRFPPEPK